MSERGHAFYRQISLAQLQGGPESFELAADAGERAALAQRFGLVALDRLEARVTAQALSGSVALRVEGRVEATLTQSCVVTLEPVVQHVDEPFRLDFGTPADVVDAASGEMLLDPEPDGPDPLPEGPIDLGELVAEQLALAIDPYPRKEGADFDAVRREAGLEEAGKRAENPFAALAELKRQR